MKKKDAEKLYRRVLKKVEEDIGSDTTDSVELNTYASSFGPWFAGVYPADKIPRRQFGAIICNLDNSTLPGSHWIAVARTKKGTYLVYDSFGRRTKKIIKLKLNTVDTEYDAEQTEDEKNCGARCIAWLIMFKALGEKVAQLI